MFKKLSLSAKFLSLLIPMTIIGSLVAGITWLQVTNQIAIMESTKNNFEFISLKNSEVMASLKNQTSETTTVKVQELTAAIKNLQKELESIEKQNIEQNQKKSIIIILVIMGGVSIVAILIGFVVLNITKVLKGVSSIAVNTVEKINEDSIMLSTSSKNISQSSSDISASLEESVASVEEISSMVKLNAKHSQQALRLTIQSNETVKSGNLELTNLILSMSEIITSSEKISEITSVIDDIAFQTNLLALNAAVEAARAGEQGKGFAVVAEAVRNLAQRSSLAAKDISNLISDSVLKIHNGKLIADKSTIIFNDIQSFSEKIKDLTKEIASASDEQSNGIDLISQALNQIDQKTQVNNNSVQKMSDVTENLKNEIYELQVELEKLNQLIAGQKT